MPYKREGYVLKFIVDGDYNEAYNLFVEISAYLQAKKKGYMEFSSMYPNNKEQKEEDQYEIDFK